MARGPKKRSTPVLEDRYNENAIDMGNMVALANCVRTCYFCIGYSRTKKQGKTVKDEIEYSIFSLSM